MDVIFIDQPIYTYANLQVNIINSLSNDFISSWEKSDFQNVGCEKNTMAGHHPLFGHEYAVSSRQHGSSASKHFAASLLSLLTL
jgi:hypothetical protein